MHQDARNNNKTQKNELLKSYIKNEMMAMKMKTESEHDDELEYKNETKNRYNHEPTQSQKDMEDKLAQLFLAQTTINIKKSKSHNSLILNPNQKSNRKLHSKSGPQPMRRRKKRTFRLAEPTELTLNRSCGSISITKPKKKSRNFMAELNAHHSPIRSGSYSPRSLSPCSSATPSPPPPPPPPIPFSQSLPADVTRRKNNDRNIGNHRLKRKRNSFKLGDESQLVLFRSHDSFETYKTKYNVHKPKIKPGSNQFLVSQKMRELQQKLKDEEKQRMNNNNDSIHLETYIDNIDITTMNEINESLERLMIKSIKLPNYSGAIPFILIELKKIHSCEG